MFSSIMEVARNSPFTGPFSTARCDADSSSDIKTPVQGRTIQAAAVQPGDSCEFGSNHFFLLCGIGGILSCGKYLNAIPIETFAN